MKAIIYIFSLLLTLNSFSQTWKEISREDLLKRFEKSESFQNTAKEFAFDISYTSFRGHDSKTPYETMSGKVWKKGKDYKSDMFGLLTVQKTEVKVVINNQLNMILVYDSDNSMNTVPTKSEYEYSLKWITKVEENISETEYAYRIYYKEGYKVEKMEVLFDKIGHVKKMTQYLSGSHTFEDANKSSTSAKPKLEISMSNYKLKDISSSEFDLSKIIVLSKDKSTYLASGKYANYKLNDVRLKR